MIAGNILRPIQQTLTHQEYALIVAGGKGTRFGSPVPKQFLKLKGKPVLLHTVEAFCRYSEAIRIVLVLPEQDVDTWHQIAAENHLKKPIVVQTGGDTRFQSVKNGLQLIPDDAIVAIHDGVRPLVTHEMIATSFKLAKLHHVAVAAVPLKESLREIIPGKASPNPETRTVDRSCYRIIQTPQTFNAGLIKEAYQLPEDPSMTDDAAVAEKAGHTIHLFEGHFNNIKITNREDLLIAEALITGSSR